MRNKATKCILLVLLVMMTGRGIAQRQVTQYYQVGLGSTEILDTYLTPEKFRGTGLTLLSVRETKGNKPEWSTVSQHQLHLATAKDRAGNAAMMEATYNFLWGKYYAWQLMDNKLQLQAGGLANVTLGAFYHTRSNANNPAQARLALNIMPSGIATYRFGWLKRKWAVRYELDMPLAGVMFSPNYGQSYYEMFSLGNYDHNIVPTTFVSTPYFRQQLMVECGVCPSLTLSLGYLGDWQQASVNGLKQHLYNNSVMFGVVKRFSITKLKNE